MSTILRKALCWAARCPSPYLLLTVLVAAGAFGADDPASRPTEDDLARSFKTSELPSSLGYQLATTVKFVHRANEGPEEENALVDVLQDGNRIDVTRRYYETAHGTKRPTYTHRTIWDGKRFVARQQYLGGHGFPMNVSASTRPTKLEDVTGGYMSEQFLDGRLYVDDLPMAAILRQSGKARLVGHELVNGRSCSIIEGKTSYGYYKLWLDEQFDYHVCKAIVRKSGGDRAIGSNYPDGVTDEFLLHDVSIKSVDGQPVGISGGLDETLRLKDGRVQTTEHSAVRTNVTLRPDLSNPKTFHMDGIPNDMPVHIDDRPAGDHFSYVWKDGRVQVDQDAELVKQMKAVVTRERATTQPEGN